MDAARTLYFPSLNLTGNAGYGPVRGSSSNLFNPATFAFSIGASVPQTIFDGGRSMPATIWRWRASRN